MLISVLALNLASMAPSALFAELARRQSDERPQCGSGINTRTYNTPLHVFALILILVLSTLACSFPLIVRRFPSLPIPNHALFLSRHFGTGVLIATAFVHLLPTAYVSLTDPCLPRFWNEVYPAMSGFIAMCAMMVVVGIEMFFATKGAGHGHSHSVDFEELRGGKSGSSATGGRRRQEYSEIEEALPLQEPQASPASLDSNNALNKPLPPEPPFADEDSDLDLDELEEDQMPLNGHPRKPLTRKSSLANGERPSPTSRELTFIGEPTYHAHPSAKDPDEQRLVLQCLLLEAGILFHSVFIGMALSVSTGPAFIVLLIAISFHQAFEGLALGSRIAAIGSFSTASLKPWIMCLLYGITTPIGQAIGLGVHTLYDPSSQFGLLTVGCVNAVSSGLLMYAGLVSVTHYIRAIAVLIARCRCNYSPKTS